MAATTLTELPTAIRAGDTLLLSISLSDYPASDSWTLTYTFRKPNGSDISFASTADGDDHAITVAYGTTQTWEPGTYSGEARVDDGSQRFTVWSGFIEVLPDLSIQDPNYDARSHARKMLDAIEAVLENRATKAILSTTIAGQSISRYSPEQLLSLRSFYRSEVDAEEAQAAADAGKSTGRNILVRFGNA